MGQAPPYGKENNDGRTVEITTAFGPAMRGLDRFPGVVRNDAKAAWSVWGIEHHMGKSPSYDEEATLCAASLVIDSSARLSDRLGMGGFVDSRHLLAHG